MSNPVVIIPAYNESGVIGRCIRSVIDAGGPLPLEIVVVCNGCKDDTADHAREIDESFVRVLETAVVSKTHALNLGDMEIEGFPRFYVDADVVLLPGAIPRLVEALGEPGVLAVSPLAQFDLSNSSWAVRAFYAITQLLPSSREAIGGSGVYALSEPGWTRVGTFPPVVGDDEFVRRHFTPQERQVVTDAVAVVTPPRNLAGLITVNTRSHYGNYQLADRFPQLTPNKAVSNRATLLRLLRQVNLWPQLLVYFFVKVMARIRAKRKLRSHAPYVWDRDDTSRQISSPVQV